VRIERKEPRCPDGEYPAKKKGCYQLGDPRLGPRAWKLAENEILVESIEEAVGLIEGQGLGIRMKCRGKRASLIVLGGLRIIRG
jgi:hypothetical protein